jgi:hypothetical protein
MFKYWNIQFIKHWDKKRGIHSLYLLPTINYFEDDDFKDVENFCIQFEWLIWCIHISYCKEKSGNNGDGYEEENNS